MNRLALLGRNLVACCSVTLLAVTASTAAGQDERHPDSAARRDGVPKGTVTEHEMHGSETYPDTHRRYSVYVPDQVKDGGTAALMVFLDGHAYVGERGDFRVPIVFDNLIAAGEMPPTVAVLIDPGMLSRQLKDGEFSEERGWNPRPANRSVEYDTPSDAYVTFLLTEVLPEVESRLKQDGIELSDDPAMRAICGSSSGGICAFTAAWERPDQFGKVISHIGSFTNIRGGHVYPALIRGQERKPIRVVLQDGSGDLDNQFGNWWLANQQMAKALEFKDYDFKTYWGEGGHNGVDAGRVFPDELKWLWRDWQSDAGEAPAAK